MSIWGIKVSKQGKDISSTDPKDFIMSSEYSTIKILVDGTQIGTVGASGTLSGTTTHGAGFYPLVMLYSELTPGSERWYASPFGSVSGENTYFSPDSDYTWVGGSNFATKLINNTGTQMAVKSRYYVIGETGR